MTHDEIKSVLAHVWPITPMEARAVLDAGGWANGEVIAENEMAPLRELAEMEECSGCGLVADDLWDDGEGGYVCLSCGFKHDNARMDLENDMEHKLQALIDPGADWNQMDDSPSVIVYPDTTVFRIAWTNRMMDFVFNAKTAKLVAQMIETALEARAAIAAATQPAK